jgi:hypothetical protein
LEHFRTVFKVNEPTYSTRLWVKEDPTHNIFKDANEEFPRVRYLVGEYVNWDDSGYRLISEAEFNINDLEYIYHYCDPQGVEKS